MDLTPHSNISSPPAFKTSLLSPLALPFTPASLKKHEAQASPVTPTTPLDLFKAVAGGSAPAVDKVLQRPGIDVNVIDVSGWTPLMYASHYGHYQVIRRLMNAGADPNKGHPHTGRAPLMLAANNGHTRCLERLVDGGADIKLCDSDGHDAAHFANQHGHGQNSLIAKILGIPISARKTTTVRTPINHERQRLMAKLTIEGSTPTGSSYKLLTPNTSGRRDSERENHSLNIRMRPILGARIRSLNFDTAL